MYAVIKTGGKQYRVTPGEKLRVEKLLDDVGSDITLNKVLMLVDSDNVVTIGAPLIAGASVPATVVSHGRDDKVMIFKFRRRKHYRKTQGHRQSYTEIQIGDFGGSKTAKTAKPEVKAAAKAEEKVKSAAAPAKAAKPAAKPAKAAAPAKEAKVAKPAAKATKPAAKAAKPAAKPAKAAKKG